MAFLAVLATGEQGTASLNNESSRAQLLRWQLLAMHEGDNLHTRHWDSWVWADGELEPRSDRFFRKLDSSHPAVQQPPTDIGAVCELDGRTVNEGPPLSPS